MAKRKVDHPHVAMALDYARGVIAGNISACVYVRQACARQLRDLDRDDWEYRFDPEAAERICRFAELLPHIKGPSAGKRILLAPWQAFVLTTAFGWLRTDTGRRRFRRVYIEVPRGNGKTTMSDAPALYMLGADGEGERADLRAYRHFRTLTGAPKARVSGDEAAPAPDEADYLGTVILDEGATVWHVFERVTGRV